MVTISRPSGLRIELPADFVIVEPTSPPSSFAREAHRHGPRPMPSETEQVPSFIEALGAQEMQTVDSLFLDVAPETAAQVRAAGPVERTVGLTLELGDEEGAVVLIEQDGVYSWHLPSEAPTDTMRARSVPKRREVCFNVVLGQPTKDVQDMKKRGFVSNFIVGRVRAFVLKFLVEWGTEKLMLYLERNVQTGLVNMNSTDPTRWTRLDSLNELTLPAKKPVRILLFIHGTFSSTIGSYGALGGTEEGRRLLQIAPGHYDAVLGFDHPTLSLSPEENARELLDILESYPWNAPLHIDIITFSRGGLVYRALEELLLPGSVLRVNVDRVIFVAVPNAGTHLAEPDNWHALLDLYTNVAVAADKLLSKIPQLTIANKILVEMIKGLGALGKYLASQAITEGDVPGLAAMEPDGPFITRINRIQAGQPTVDTTFYCAVTSEFEVRLFGDQHEPKEFPKHLAMTVVDQIADRLFGEANDLVVDTKSMTAIDDVTANFIKDHFSFGKNPLVYHTVYFAQPAVARVMCRWLRLDAPHTAAVLSGSGNWVAPGEVVAPVLPPEVNTNLLVTTSNETIDALRDDLKSNSSAEFVIVRRPYEKCVLNYAYRRKEVEEMSRSQNGDTLVLDGLGMHEFQASEDRTLMTSIEPPLATGGGPTTGRAVVLDGDRPVGVVPEPDFSMTKAVELGDLVFYDITPESETPPDEAGSSATGAGEGFRSRQADSATREAPTAAAPLEEEPLTAVVQCHFYAEMPSTVMLNEDVSLLVSISRETILAATGMAATGETAPINPERKIILDVRPRKNFAVVGSPRAEIDPPAPDNPAEIYFSLRPTDLDDGEVWVTARQGQFPLVTLRLQVRILATMPQIVPLVVVHASTDEPPTPATPMCQLRIFERSNGQNISYEYDLDIPGVIFDRFESTSIRSDRLEYIQNLYREIEHRWISAQQDMDDFAQEMREMGGSLFTQLFPLELQQALWDNRNAIRRIQVISTEPFIPWEIVHLAEPGQPLPDESLFLAQLGVVRWLHGSYYPNEVCIRPGRACYVIPDYPHPKDKLPGTADEAMYLQQAFNATKVDPHPLPIRQILRGPGGFDLLHFAGHGISELDDIVNSQLQLEGRIEQNTVIPEYLSSTAVEQQSRLQGADGNRPMVVLNACQAGRIGRRLTGTGGFAAAFLQRGAGIFVSTLWSVSDQPAKDFVLKLYDELRNGDELAEAVITAREAARLAGDASWLCYVVYGHPNAKVITSTLHVR